MKHVVTLTTSNPSHEHVSLRRKQSTTNFMVEAADEDQAIFRASAHFRKLGYYIHEAKIFKKKDQLNELASNSSFIDDSATKAGLKRNPGESDADLVKRITAAKGINDQGIKPVFPEPAVISGAAGVARSVAAKAGSSVFDKLMQSTKDVETGLGNLGTAIVDKGTSIGKVVRDELASHAASLPINLGITAATNAATGKETNLGSIVKDTNFWNDYANIPRLSIGTRFLNLLKGAAPKRAPIPRRVPTPQRKAPERKPGFPGMPSPGPRRERPTTKPKEEPVPVPAPSPKPAPAPAPKPAPTPEPGPITLPPVPAPKPAPVPPITPKPIPNIPQPNKPPVPGTAPAPVPLPKTTPSPVPSPKPAPAPVPKTEPLPKPQPEPAPDKALKYPQSPPITGLAPVPRVNPAPVPKPKPNSAKPGSAGGSILPFMFGASTGNRGDEDIGTLGQYRGMAAMFQHHQFNEEMKGSSLNAIGRVLSKRKQRQKDDAESEKNKINMEPKLKSK